MYEELQFTGHQQNHSQKCLGSESNVKWLIHVTQSSGRQSAEKNDLIHFSQVQMQRPAGGTIKTKWKHPSAVQDIFAIQWSKLRYARSFASTLVQLVFGRLRRFLESSKG